MTEESRKIITSHYHGEILEKSIDIEKGETSYIIIFTTRKNYLNNNFIY